MEKIWNYRLWEKHVSELANVDIDWNNNIKSFKVFLMKTVAYFFGWII